jgi:hypothetical protein
MPTTRHRVPWAIALLWVIPGAIPTAAVAWAAVRIVRARRNR